MFLSNKFLMNNWLNMIMDYILMVLMHNIFVFLFNYVLVMFVNDFLLVLLDNWSVYLFCSYTLLSMSK